MSDPNFKAEEAPPPQPPRPQPRSQLEQDEIFARQLAQHYESQGGSGPQRPRQQGSHQRQGEPEREYSFFDGGPLPVPYAPAVTANGTNCRRPPRDPQEH